MRGGAAAPLRTVHPAVGDPAHLLEDRAHESNAAPGAAVHLPGRQTDPESAALSLRCEMQRVQFAES